VEVVEMQKITSFFGAHRFLSNFYPGTVMLSGIQFSCVECAYQAAKTLNHEERLAFVGLSAGEAKRRGRTLRVRADWLEVRLQVMEDLVRQKFSNPALATRLLGTGEAVLEEGNTWGDRFWGVDARTGEGENHLGLILMRVRNDLARERADGLQP
jgi:ribA/ribD-fused uncharacterized protein